jgi:hypothetical protein
MLADGKVGFKEKMKTKLVLLSVFLSIFGLSAFACFNPVSAQTGKQTTVKEKAALTQLVLQDKEVKEGMTGDDSPSVGDITEGITLKKIDLNKDGQPEYLTTLGPFLCGVTGNCLTWVYRKTGDEYQLLLRTSGRQLLLEKTSTGGFRDLRMEAGNSADKQDFSIYRFDGNKYLARVCYTQTYSGKGRKLKITRWKCGDSQ